MGDSADPRPRAAGRRRRQRRPLIILAGALSSAVVIAGALAALGVMPPAGVPSPPANSHRQSQPPPKPPGHPLAGAIGSYRVAFSSLSFTDRSRRRLGTRILPTLVRYPVVPPAEITSGEVTRGPFSLVLFAPGYRQCRSSYASLLRAWASAGYVVAAIEFPRTNCHTVAPDEADLFNQPADISFVISRLTALSAMRAGPLSGLIDPDRIAVSGHSDGGDAAVAVAAGTCCRDRRVRAALILSGAQWPPLGGRYFPPGSPPVLFTQGSADTWNLPAASMQLYQADRTGVRYYLDLLGSGHFTPYQGHAGPEPLVARVTVDFLNAYLGDQPARIKAMALAGNMPGVAVLYGQGNLPR